MRTISVVDVCLLNSLSNFIHKHSFIKLINRAALNYSNIKFIFAFVLSIFEVLLILLKKFNRIFYTGIILLAVVLQVQNFSFATSVNLNGPSVDYDCQANSVFSVPEEGCAIFVDLDNSKMTVYVGGELYKEYSVSGGSTKTPSPVGSWRVNHIANWGEGFGGSWIGLNVPWGEYGIHGTPEPWMIGKCNDSQGCIRMKNEDVAEIKKLVYYGTMVHIKHDSAPFRSIENGMVGSDVLNTQKKLIKLKFYTGSADGVFGDGMERSVRSFQKVYHLRVDGIVGRQTFNKICEQYDLLD